MNFDFPLILFSLTVISGLIILFDKIYNFFRFKSGNNQDLDSTPKVISYSKSLFPVFLIVFLIRSFVVEPFRVPTGSLEPTVMPGDFILSSKFSYGLRMPIWGNKIVPLWNPKRGDIVIFHTPQDQKTWLVKRLIGLPGDKISYINKILYINGQQASQVFVKDTQDIEGATEVAPAKEYTEDLLGIKHEILIRADIPDLSFKDLVVPAGHYFMMGDNRDDSEDSRWWGFVPAKNIEGKAVVVWFSIDQFNWTNIRWKRMGTLL